MVRYESKNLKEPVELFSKLFQIVLKWKNFFLRVWFKQEKFPQLYSRLGLEKFWKKFEKISFFQ